MEVCEVVRRTGLVLVRLDRVGRVIICFLMIEEEVAVAGMVVLIGVGDVVGASIDCEISTCLGLGTVAGIVKGLFCRDLFFNRFGVMSFLGLEGKGNMLGFIIFKGREGGLDTVMGVVSMMGLDGGWSLREVIISAEVECIKRLAEYWS